jgi:hypothetical protein
MVDSSAEKREYDQDLSDEYSEIIAEQKEDYEQKFADYNSQMKALKSQQTRKTEARKRVEDREKNKEKFAHNISALATEKVNFHFSLAINILKFTLHFICY